MTLDATANTINNNVAMTAEIQSVAAAIQNMLLMAYSLGLGGLWINNIYYALDALERHLDKP